MKHASCGLQNQEGSHSQQGSLATCLGGNILGMRLNHDGITIDPSKIKGLMDWPRELKNVKEICKILGVLRYQRPFIPNFASFARPLTNLLKKETPFEWTPNCCASLDTLIDIVTSCHRC
jgi:hypothetical protein